MMQRLLLFAVGAAFVAGCGSADPTSSATRGVSTGSGSTGTETTRAVPIAEQRAAMLAFGKAYDRAILPSYNATLRAEEAFTKSSTVDDLFPVYKKYLVAIAQIRQAKARIIEMSPPDELTPDDQDLLQKGLDLKARAYTFRLRYMQLQARIVDQNPDVRPSLVAQRDRALVAETNAFAKSERPFVALEKKLGVKPRQFG